MQAYRQYGVVSSPALYITNVCTLLAKASDKVYQLPAHGRRFSPGTPASSTTKTGRHDIVEMLLKVALNTKNQIKSSFHNHVVVKRSRDIVYDKMKALLLKMSILTIFSFIFTGLVLCVVHGVGAIGKLL